MKMYYILEVLKRIDGLRNFPYENLDEFTALQIEMGSITNKEKLKKSPNKNFIDILEFLSDDIYFIKEEAITEHLKNKGVL